jgi:hypothetical protein
LLNAFLLHETLGCPIANLHSARSDLCHIETLFSDLKGRGFNLQKSGLRAPEQVSRLIIAAALAYIGMVYLGELTKEKGWDKIIPRKDRCDLSLFTLGMCLLKRLLREGKTLPQFCLTLSGKALL